MVALPIDVGRSNASSARMPVAVSTVLSTVSLVAMRSLGVGARALALLTLAAGMPADEFANYALAFVFSELARCATDFGLDPVVLRRAEVLSVQEQHSLMRDALAVRVSHGFVAGAIMIGALTTMFPVNLLIIAAGLQFLPQGLLQLGLNWRQANNSAHLVAPVLAVFYLTVIGLAVAAYFYPAVNILPIPFLVVGEMVIAICLLSPLKLPHFRDLVTGYRLLVPQALPMAGILLLAFINTRTDALLVSYLVDASDAGRYLYIMRWIDLAPMLAAGIALPLVGKVTKLDWRRFAPLVSGFVLTLAAAPFVLVQIAGWLNPAYAGDQALRVLLALVGACRIGLAMTTTGLLAKWHDGLLVRLAMGTTILLPILTWIIGSRYGLHGIAAAVLMAETGNFLLQTTVLLRHRNSFHLPVRSHND